MRRASLLLTVIVSALSLSACNSADKGGENEAMCKSVKPGTVTTVNHYCVVNMADPVNPEIKRDHHGKSVGFCCNGCIKKWDAMTDAQKDAAISAAVAKGMPKQ